MKTKTLALFASLAVLTTIARAAQDPIENKVVVLPAYSIEVPRQTAAEREVTRSLDELRAVASTPLAVRLEIPLLKTRELAAKPAPARTVAKV